MKIKRAVRLNMSLMLCNEGDFNGAITQTNVILKENPSDMKALFRRATAYFKLNRLKEAKDDLKIAFK